MKNLNLLKKAEITYEYKYLDGVRISDREIR